MSFAYQKKRLSVAMLFLSVASFGSVLTAIVVSRAFAADAPAEGFVALFNGKDLDGWDGDAQFWSVEDGTIVGQTTAEKPTKHNTFLVWKGGMVGDFELHASYKIVGGNSGIQYRSKAMEDHIVSGYQADIVDGDPDKYSGILYEERGRGILAERGQKVTIDAAGKKEVSEIGDAKAMAKDIKRNEWNDYVIIAQGDHLVQKINGVTTVDVTDAETAKAAREGILALQIHMGPPMKVQFKDIQLKVLKDQPKPPAQ